VIINLNELNMSATLIIKKTRREILDDKLRKCIGAESQLLSLLRGVRGQKQIFDVYLKVVQRQIMLIGKHLPDVENKFEAKNKVVRAIIDCGYHMIANNPSPEKISKAMFWMIKSINRYKIALYEAEREFAASVRNESLVSFFSSALMAESQFAKDFDRLSDHFNRSAAGLQNNYQSKLSELC